MCPRSQSRPARDALCVARGGTGPCHGLLLTLHLCPQCEASLDGEAGLCWCVYPWSGKRIPESAKVRGDPNCPQYFH